MNDVFLHSGDRFIIMFPDRFPKPLYLGEFNFSPAYGFRIKLCKTKKLQ